MDFKGEAEKQHYPYPSDPSQYQQPPPSYPSPYAHIPPSTTSTNTNSDPAPNLAWQSVPDSALLPPPPRSGYEQPLQNNADSTEAERAHIWCRANPFIFPGTPTSEQILAVSRGEINIIRPFEFQGKLAAARPGRWDGTSLQSTRDSGITTSLPLYFATSDSPSHTGQRKTVYYEVEIISLGKAPNKEDSATIALGYAARPQPTWRLPGWQRGSLGIHSDDGHRYVNDPWGGKDCTQPFGAGDTIGIGMDFSVPSAPPGYADGSSSTTGPLLKSDIEVFVTRNGLRVASWDLHEELDYETDQGIEGLDGLFDLFPVIGVYGQASFSIRFKREEWEWRPR